MQNSNHSRTEALLEKKYKNRQISFSLNISQTSTVIIMSIVRDDKSCYLTQDDMSFLQKRVSESQDERYL